MHQAPLCLQVSLGRGIGSCQISHYMMITVDDELLVSILHTALWSALKITDERRRRRDHDYVNIAPFG